MKSLRWQAQRLLRAIGLPGWAALAMLALCAAGWLSLTAPLQAETQRLAMQALQLEQRGAEQRGAVLADVSPQQQMAQFLARFPEPRGITPALTRLHAAARRQGVQLDQAEFRFANEAGEPLLRYVIVLPVKSDYRALRSFVREAMRELPGLALEEVNLRRSDITSSALEAQLRFVLFVKRGP
jgi:hypothetical protein